MSVRSYKYEPLQENRSIRLLSLSSGKPNDSLQGSLLHTTLDLCPPYRALSYAWCGSDKVQTLALDEDSAGITASLYSALRDLREEENAQMIWADALCINQDDNEEKSHQVRLMADIYSKAVQVVVHLGEEADDSTRAMEFLYKLANTDLPGDMEQMVPLSKRSLDIPPIDDEIWEATRALLRRPWFCRVWVIQEFVVGADVIMICGPASTSWMNILAAVYKLGEAGVPHLTWHLYNNDKEKTRATQQAANMISQFGWLKSTYDNGERQPMLHLLRIFRDAYSTRQRDHLFALLGLAADASNSALDPNYDESLESVVSRFARFLIERTHSLEVLYHCSWSSQPSRFPSWVPDWTKRFPADSMLAASNTVTNKIFDAAFDKTAHPSFNSSSTLLRIKGLRVDTIGQVGRDHSSEDDRDPTELALLRMYVGDTARLVSLLNSYPTGEDIQEVHWRALIANTNKEGIELSPSLGDAFLALSEMVKRLDAGETTQAPGMGTLHQAMIPYLPSILRIMGGRKFCLTERGYVGLVMNQVLPDDLVYVLYGAAVPFVLRPAEDQPGSYRIVGDCYIHGIMKGEAVRSSTFQEEEIVIC